MEMEAAMLLDRRTFLTMAAVACAATTVPAFRVYAAEDFRWTDAGADKYRGTFEEALRLFSDIVPAVVLEDFQSNWRARHYTDTIPDNFRFTRMLFGDMEVRSNVVAVTSEWDLSASRAVNVYSVRHTDGHTYVLFRPRVCGNWGIAVFTPQGVCIRDPILCDEDDCSSHET